MRHRWALAPFCIAAALVFAAAASALVPSDPLANHPAYTSLNLPTAWEISTGSPDVVIAIVDSGVDPAHPELAGAVLPGYDFFADRAGATPVDGHGTGVSGAAAGRANNGLGGVGACFTCRILPLQVFGPNGFASTDHIAKAIDYAVNHGAAVVNISLSAAGAGPELEQAIARARVAGVLVVAAAGNDAQDIPRFPAALPGVISVGASTYDGRRAPFSNHGSWVRFAAPECAPIARLGGGTEVGCGTSFAAPLVSGVVALMRARAPFATLESIEGNLAFTARAVPGTRFGVPDAAEALRALRNPSPRLSPTVLGSASVGGRLEAFSGIWVGAGVRTSVQWERCLGGDCSLIAGATSSRYTPTEADARRRLRAVVTAEELGAAASPLTRTVESQPRPVVRPSIFGRPRPGSRLTASVGRWIGQNLRLDVLWQRCRKTCDVVALGRVYRVREADRAHRLRVLVQATNSVGQGAAFSNATRVVR